MATHFLLLILLICRRKNQFTQCTSVSGKFSHLSKEMVQYLIQFTFYFQFPIRVRLTKC